jgi:pilus assembly protein CpaB
MKFKTIVLLAFAVGCGLVAMMGVQQVLADRANREKASKVKILVAAVDIMPGIPLDDTNTTTKEWPRDLVPEAAITTKEQYVERALKSQVFAGEMILATKLTEKGQFGASSAIPAGMRVVTIPVNETKTHSGMLMPGDRVDILVTYKAKVETVGMVSKTRTLLEYIEVFAADSQRTAETTDNKEVKAKNISLLVTPQQVEIIKLASDKGSLDLSLRGKGDSEMVANRGVDESLLEELSSGMNYTPKVEEKHPAESTPAPTPVASTDDINKFLGGSFYPAEKETKVAEPVAVVAPLPAPEPVPTWRVQIYSGEEILHQDFSLPENASEQARKAAVMVMPEKGSQTVTRSTNSMSNSAAVSMTSPAAAGSPDMTDLIKSMWKQQPQSSAKVNSNTEKDLEQLLNKGLEF